MDRALLESLLGFLDESPWPHILLWDLLCVEKRQQGGFAPWKLDRGGDDQTSVLLFLMPMFKSQERKQVMTAPCFCPSGRPSVLTHCPTPTPHSKAFPGGILSPRSCSITRRVVLPSVTSQPRGSVQSGGAGSRSAGESHGSGVDSK